jgi:hypothetical protein
MGTSLVARAYTGQPMHCCSGRLHSTFTVRLKSGSSLQHSFVHTWDVQDRRQATNDEGHDSNGDTSSLRRAHVRLRAMQRTETHPSCVGGRICRRRICELRHLRVAILPHLYLNGYMIWCTQRVAALPDHVPCRKRLQSDRKQSNTLSRSTSTGWWVPRTR